MLVEYLLKIFDVVHESSNLVDITYSDSDCSMACTSVNSLLLPQWHLGLDKQFIVLYYGETLISSRIKQPCYLGEKRDSLYLGSPCTYTRWSIIRISQHYPWQAIYRILTNIHHVA